MGSKMQIFSLFLIINLLIGILLYIVSFEDDMNCMNKKGAILILACDRPNSLNISLYSLSKIKSHFLPIYISFDCRDNKTINIANYWMDNKQMNITVLFSSSIDIEENIGTLRVKYHWLSAVNKMFMKYKYDYIIYMEDDHIVHSNITQTAHHLVNYVDNNMLNHSIWEIGLSRHLGQGGELGNFDAYDKDLLSKTFVMEGNMNMAVIYFKNQWNMFMKYVDIFCELGYGWDSSLHAMLRRIPSLPSYSLFLLKPRAWHLAGNCYSTRLGKKFEYNKDHKLYCSNISIINEYQMFMQSFSMNWLSVTDVKQIQYVGIENRRSLPDTFGKYDEIKKDKCLQLIN
eukprot:338620_1